MILLSFSELPNVKQRMNSEVDFKDVNDGLKLSFWLEEIAKKINCALLKNAKVIKVVQNTQFSKNHEIYMKVSRKFDVIG